MGTARDNCQSTTNVAYDGRTDLPISHVLLRRIYLAIATLSWLGLLAALLVHMALTYAALSLAGEKDLTANTVDFFYYYITTATTVGYGDLSPSGPAGRWAALLFILPGSIAIFTAVLGKAITDLSAIWRRGMNGLGNYSERQGHTIVLGWQGLRTRKLIDLLEADRLADERIVLVDKALEQNPIPSQLDYVRADALSALADLDRAGMSGAARVIVRGASDDETLAATLAVTAAAKRAHVVAYFEDEQAAGLVTRQCPDVETVGSLSAELLVRASRDPGASRVADRLLSSKTADTAYAMTLPIGAKPTGYLDALVGLKRRYGLTLVGLAKPDTETVDLNCTPDTVISAGDTIFYIADARLSPDSIAWADLAAAAY